MSWIAIELSFDVVDRPHLVHREFRDETAAKAYVAASDYSVILVRGTVESVDL